MNKKLTFRYVFEVIVIVFSVTLSFYIQELLSDREKNLLKNDGLNGVIKDLVVDKSQFKNASDVIYYRIGLIEDVLDGNITNKNISSLMTYWGFLGQDSNYKSLISTGAIEYIKSDSLALRLSNYYEIEYTALLGESKSYNKLYLDLMSFMKEKYRVSSMEKVERGMKSNGFLSFEYSNSELEKMKRDGELRNYFFELKRIIYLYARMFEGAMSTTDRLSEYIRIELDKTS